MDRVTHRIKVIECKRGFFSLCKSALQGVTEAHREDRDARCSIDIRGSIYAAYVLSRCAVMLSGVSNLSDWAAILSPDMPWVRLV